MGPEEKLRRRLIPVTAIAALLVCAGATGAALALARDNARSSTGAQMPPESSTTAPTSPTSSISPTAPVSPSAAASLTAAFRGSFQGHGRLLTINAAGEGMLGYRIYRWCSDDPRPPCDAVQGNTIINGGRMTVQITAAHYEGAVLVGSGVARTNDPAVPSGPVTLRLSEHILTLSNMPDEPLCTPEAAFGACGA